MEPGGGGEAKIRINQMEPRYSGRGLTARGVRCVAMNHHERLVVVIVHRVLSSGGLIDDIKIVCPESDLLGQVPN